MPFVTGGCQFRIIIKEICSNQKGKRKEAAPNARALPVYVPATTHADRVPKERRLTPYKETKYRNTDNPVAPISPQSLLASFGKHPMSTPYVSNKPE